MPKKICIANPFNEDELNLLKEYEKTNNLHSKILPFLNSIKEAKTKEEYEKSLTEENDIIQSIYIKDGNFIKDCCFLEGKKDIKKCTISFSELQKKAKTRQLLTLVTDYALNTLNMQEVFIILAKDDTNFQQILEANNYENLGDVNGFATYLKEKSIL